MDLEIMKEIVPGTVETLKELLEEEIRPLIEYRAELEKKIANKEIAEMLKLEQEAR